MKPTVQYSPQDFPSVERGLYLLHATTVANHNNDCIQRPNAFPEFHNALGSILANHAADATLTVVSFDIDLTLNIGEEFDEGLNLIDPHILTTLQDAGCLVGTCSDRDVYDQEAVLDSFDIVPHFTLPKELLYTLRILLPTADITHVGDDVKRDAYIAKQADIPHLYPSQFKEEMFL